MVIVVFQFHAYLAIELAFFGFVLACVIWTRRSIYEAAIFLVLVCLIAVFVYPFCMGHYSERVHEQTRRKLHTLVKGILDHEKETKLFPLASTSDANGKPLLSWRVTILPQLGYSELYKRFHHDEPWDSPHNLELLPLMPEVYRSSVYTAEPKPGHTVFVTLAGPDTFLSPINRLSTFKTDMDYLAVLTLSKKSVPWTAPFDLTLESTADDVSPDVTVKSPLPISRTLFNLGYEGDEYHFNCIQIGFGDGTIREIYSRSPNWRKEVPKLFRMRDMTDEKQRLNEVFYPGSRK